MNRAERERFLRRGVRGGLMGLLLLAIAGLAPACSRGKEGAKPGREAGPSSRRMDFERHLHLGLEQLRRYLPDSARAEFEACAALRRGDPDLLFHQARLALMSPGGSEGLEGAIRLLERALEERPGSVRIHRLLFELQSRKGEAQAASAHRGILERTYGQVGEMEAMSQAAYLQGRGGPNIRIPKPRAGAPNAGDLRAFAGAFRKLQRRGSYAPSEAVPALEGLFERYPDLIAVRIYYAKLLVMAEVRVNYSDRPGLPPMSSKLILDIAQSHFEEIFDQVSPGSPMAHDVLYMLSHVAMLMGDYDDSLTFTDILLGVPTLRDSFRRFQIGRRALARYKQGAFGEAIGLLDRALDGAKPGFPQELPFLWLLHLAHESAGTKPVARKRTFRFRADLALAGDPSPVHFRDVAHRYRIDKLDGLGPSAWADVDRDGDFDLFVCGCDSYGALYRNDGGVFTDVSREAGLFHVQSGYSATLCDFDNDGWPDLYIGRDGWNGPIGNSLYRNRGDGTFVDVTEKAGVGHPGSSFVHQWSDYDRDGDLDLLVANGITGGGDTNVLYRNNGNGTFTDVTKEAGLQEPPGTKTIGVAFGDYDGDGWPDVFVSGYKRPNRLYHNKGNGTFENLAKQAGIEDGERLTTGYVCFFLDYDDDGDLDVLRPALAPWNDVLLGLSDRFASLPPARRKEMQRACPRLYRNNGGGTFTDVSVEAGFVHPIGSMGTGVADVDNDGYLDVYFGTGDPAIERMEADRFYRNNGDGTFSDLTFAAGLGNTGKGHGITFIDIDGDGDLEIYAPEGGFVMGDPWPNSFYLNEQTTGNHWLHVDLEGTKSNREGLDARILVTAGGRTLMREKHNGEGFGSSNSPTVEFGLGEAARVERLEIRWPSGTVQVFEDVPADRRILVREGEPWRPWAKE